MSQLLIVIRIIAKETAGCDMKNQGKCNSSLVQAPTLINLKANFLYSQKVVHTHKLEPEIQIPLQLKPHTVSWAKE